MIIIMIIISGPVVAQAFRRLSSRCPRLLRCTLSCRCRLCQAPATIVCVCVLFITFQCRFWQMFMFPGGLRFH